MAPATTVRRPPTRRQGHLEGIGSRFMTGSSGHNPNFLGLMTGEPGHNPTPSGVSSDLSGLMTQNWHFSGRDRDFGVDFDKAILRIVDTPASHEESSLPNLCH